MPAPSRPTPTALREQARRSVRARALRVRSAWKAILVTAVAGALAWLLAGWIVGQSVPFFAPVTAVISLGVTRGQPVRKAAEIALGVAIGIGVADLLVHVVGSGTVQVAVLIGATMAVALFLEEGVLFINQAAISAVLVMTLPYTASAHSSPSLRFFDALVGGAVAVVMSQVLLARDPLGPAHSALRSLLHATSETLRDVASALRDGDGRAADAALSRSRGLDAQVDAVVEELRVARGVARWSPPRRRIRGEMARRIESARHLDYAIRNTRVLARTASTALRRRVALEPELADAVDALADAVDALDAPLTGTGAADAGRERAEHAIRRATDVLRRHHDLSTTMIVGQVRATAFDLLRATGVEAQAATDLIDRSLEDEPQPGDARPAADEA